MNTNMTGNLDVFQNSLCHCALDEIIDLALEGLNEFNYIAYTYIHAWFSGF